MMYDDRDIMELDDVVGIACKGIADFEYNIDFAFDTVSQSTINYGGKGTYLLNH